MWLSEQAAWIAGSSFTGFAGYCRRHGDRIRVGETNGKRERLIEREYGIVRGL